MSHPLLSVVIPAYNAARFLPDAVDSVRRQSYPCVQIVVVDDGSIDNTREVVLALGGDITYVYQPNSGPSAARNAGLTASRGDVIGFLDADDLWPDDKVSMQMARLAADPSLQVVLGRIRYVALPGAELPDIKFDEDGTITHVHLGSGLYRREVFNTVGTFDTSLRYCEDVDWFMRAREQHVAMSIQRAVTLLYRVHGNNMTADRSRPDALLAPVLKKSLERRRAAGRIALRPWLSYDEQAGNARPTISVVMPAYQAERFVGQAIQSVLDQTYSPVELIVVDDGSTDGTAAVIRDFGPRVRFYQQSNAGPGAARNAGVARATGQYVAFLDADDYWERGKLAVQAAILDQNPDVGFVFSLAQQFQTNSGEHINVGEAMPGYVPGTLLGRRDAIDHVGAFPTDVSVGEFIQWYGRAQALGIKSMMVPNVLMHRRIHDNNLGVRARDSRSDYLKVLKSGLDRRRAQSA